MANIAFKEQDSDYLEKLFDGIISSNKENSVPTKTCSINEVNTATDHVINRIGKLTRQLHDCLRELGYDQKIRQITSAVPVTHDDLNYISIVHQQAADKVLNAIDIAQPVINKIEFDSERFEQEWRNLLDNKIEINQFKTFVKETQAILLSMSKQAKITKLYLRDIMMAQEFQDITGQVIKRLIDVTLQMEAELMDILVHNHPAMEGSYDSKSLLNDYVNKIAEQSDIVAGQVQVDNLLEDLGF